MRKSNWVAYIVAAIIAAFLLWLWFYLGFDHVDAPLDLVLTVIWCCIIVGAGLLIRRIEMKRQMRMRTCYVAGKRIFNPEKGFVDIEEGSDPVDAIRKIISDLDYSFHLEQAGENERENGFAADYAVHSEKFKPKRDVWTGTVEQAGKGRAAGKEAAPIEFGDVGELREAVARFEGNRCNAR